MKLTSLSAFLFVVPLALGACKKQDEAPTAEAGKPIEARPASGEISLQTYATDKMTMPDMSTKYPAGTVFTFKGKLADEPTCSDHCMFNLTDGGKTKMSFMLKGTNKAKLDGKKTGDEVTLSCDPVYAGGMMQTADSCNVQ